jgi:predicted TIM-barrel enzyme
MFKLSRDPAFYVALFATVIRLAAAFVVDLSADQQTWLNAGAAAAGGLIVAFWVKHDGQIAALTGFASALLAIAVGFGANISAEGQAAIMSFVGVAAAAFIRTQVTAPVSAEGVRQA